jgi:hypothetical protein
VRVGRGARLVAPVFSKREAKRAHAPAEAVRTRIQSSCFVMTKNGFRDGRAGDSAPFAQRMIVVQRHEFALSKRALA